MEKAARRMLLAGRGARFGADSALVGWGHLGHFAVRGTADGRGHGSRYVRLQLGRFQGEERAFLQVRLKSSSVSDASNASAQAKLEDEDEEEVEFITGGKSQLNALLRKARQDALQNEAVNFDSYAEFSEDFDNENEKEQVKRPQNKGRAGLEVVRESAELQEGDEAGIEAFDFHPKLLNRLRKCGISSLFPVQVKTFEAARRGEDMIVRSRTGSGKTLAFALPVIDNILRVQDEHGRSKTRGSPAALVLTPTRELALQVHNEFERVAPGLKCVSVYGGASIGPQISALAKPVDIVVGTPGRVFDHLNNGRLRLSEVKTAILDEADEMLKVGFMDQIDEIYEFLPSKHERQNLLFSATVEKSVRNVAARHLNNGKLIDLVGDDADKIPKGIDLQMIAAYRSDRTSAIAAVLSSESQNREVPLRAICFVPTKAMAVELASSDEIGASGIKCLAMHGDLSQLSREKTLSAFREGRVQCLVATDVAARGLDIPSVDLVIHHSMPQDKDFFVHRAGRTGRAGKSGRNVILYDRRELDDVREIERMSRAKFRMMAMPSRFSMSESEIDSILARFEASRQGRPSDALVDASRELLSEISQNHWDETVEMLASALSLASSKTKLMDFSAITGRPNNVTLLVKQVPVDRRRLRGKAIDQRSYWQLRRGMEGYLSGLLSKPIDVDEMVLEVRPLANGEGCLVDVDPVVAENLFPTGKVFVMHGELPALLEVQQRQGGSMNGRKNFDGRRRSRNLNDFDRFDDFGRGRRNERRNPFKGREGKKVNRNRRG